MNHSFDGKVAGLSLVKLVRGAILTGKERDPGDDQDAIPWRMGLPMCVTP
jgi:hypothetical protein